MTFMESMAAPHKRYRWKLSSGFSVALLPRLSRTSCEFVPVDNVSREPEFGPTSAAWATWPVAVSEAELLLGLPVRSWDVKGYQNATVRNIPARLAHRCEATPVGSFSWL